MVVWRYLFSRSAVDWRSWAAFGVRGSSGPVRRADHPANPMATRTQRSQRRRRSHTVRREARTRTRSIARVQLANGRAYAGVRRVPALPPLAPEPSYPPLRAYLPIFLTSPRPPDSFRAARNSFYTGIYSRYGIILVYTGIYRGRFSIPGIPPAITAAPGQNPPHPKKKKTRKKEDGPGSLPGSHQDTSPPSSLLLIRRGGAQ